MPVFIYEGVRYWLRSQWINATPLILTNYLFLSTMHEHKGYLFKPIFLEIISRMNGAENKLRFTILLVRMKVLRRPVESAAESRRFK